jgi:hypothetical protein
MNLRRGQEKKEPHITQEQRHVEIILAIEEEVSKIQPLGIETQTELVEEEVKTIEMEIHVKNVEAQVGIEPLVAVQVEITEIIIEETNV